MAETKIVILTLLFLGRPSLSRVTVWMHIWYVLFVGFVLEECTVSYF